MNKDYLYPSLTNTETITILKNKILNGIPFSLTRFGDGEIYVMNRNGNQQFLKRVLNEYGYEYPLQIDNFHDDANKILRNSFLKSDIIGLMNPNDVVAKKINYSEKVWSLKKSFVESFGVDIEKLQICNHMISRSEEMGSVDGFRDIIQGNDFHIISTNINLLKTKNLESLFGVNIGYTEHPFTINFNNRDSFINRFKNIKEKIVIMGIGLQKDYGVILRDNYDKITIDMGATMDAWSGLITRPWFNKGQSQDYLLL